ncbi:myristoyl transferase [Leptolyngbya sp. 'hensonii']|uniref:ABC transporter substrate-binding protein n=1 Tax=Leptolyngbya sp. 'hensonii' TaxID=1922337 RepID=UPI00094FC659|nr:ABC transporter substrate-binding protein [Leptolyngbya sp. 'hensonii']OLP16222.1 myristoyl transferase [Leptolyngbya sp. 'hensonii']
MRIHNLTRRQALWMMGGTIAGISLHACTTPSGQQSVVPASNETPLKASMAVTTWIGNAPIYIAREKGFYQELGLELDIKVFDIVAQAFPALTSGQMNGLAPVISEAITLAAQGADFRIVLVEDTSLGADVVLARNSIGSIQDFKGKKIAVELGGIGHFFLLQILAEVGLREQDVMLINTAPDAAAAAWQAGRIEIAYSYSPFYEKALATQKDGRVIYSSKQMPTAIVDIYVFNTRFIETNPKAISTFIQGHFKGLEFLQNNPKEALPIMARQLKITPEELEPQLKGIQIPDLKMNRAMLGDPNSNLYLLKPMTEMAKFLKEQGKIPKIPDLSKLLDPQFVNAL